MRNLTSPEIDRWRFDHPMCALPDECRPWAGAFEIPFRPRNSADWSRCISVGLRVIASRGGSPFEVRNEANNWDHASVSTAQRCPTWDEMEFVKRLFFERDECAMQLHVPPAEHINNHEFCLHIWRPLRADIPRPPSIMVGVAGATGLAKIRA